MAASTLHIANGDNITQALKRIKINGEIITWREILCEGKTTIDIGSEVFWKTRFDFFKGSYKITKKAFIDYTLREYRNLCKQKTQEEIVLWFDNDLSCQINMIAVISWLKRFRKGRKISIVLNKNNDMEVNFLQNKKNDLLIYYKNRITLNEDDIEYADYIWQLYCSDSPLRLENIHTFNTTSAFSNIEKTIKMHLKRFPSFKNGLNNLENQILSLVGDSKIGGKKELIAKISENQKIYGFNDLQYTHKLDKMKKLFSSLNPVKLSKKGKMVLENQLNFYGQIRSDFSYLGGSKKYSYLYVNDTKKLLKITS
ncbi:MAG TPA: DUF1835 domain-containing protein [Tenacibaculum sp.]|nr:DUF1835 domain-containing protein [Tenacibaculum sp.]